MDEREKRFFFVFGFTRRLIEPLEASTRLHKPPPAPASSKIPAELTIAAPKPPFQKPQLQEPAEKASLATDPLVLPPPSLHSPPLSMTDNNLRILLSSDNHLGYNDKDPIRARLLCSL